MRVLVLAPHPFYQVRGTPIDLDLLLRALSARPRVRVDALVYGEGEDRSYPNVTLHRAPSPPFTRGVKPGFSLRKLACDALMFVKAWWLVSRNAYDVVHAGEEAAFMALFFKLTRGIPYVFDLDSSIAQQMVEKVPALAPLGGLLDRVEGLAIRQALATAPVCNALAALCAVRGARRIVTLHDISQLRDPDAPVRGDLRREAGLDPERLILLYVGNLEAYQGIDLLLQSFAIAAQRGTAVDLVVIGGDADDIRAYRAKVEALGIADRVHMLGPRPLDRLEGYLLEADILVAPRIRGINTPMKVFPYLHSGRAVLVTDLPTHSQILTQDVACLAEPIPEAFAEAILRLAGDPELRARLGARGRAFVEANHTYAAHQRRVDALYEWVDEVLAQRRRRRPRSGR